MGQVVFGLFAGFHQRDFNLPVAIVQLAEGLAYFVLRPEWTKGLDLTDRDGRRCDNG